MDGRRLIKWFFDKVKAFPLIREILSSKRNYDGGLDLSSKVFPFSGKQRRKELKSEQRRERD